MPASGSGEVVCSSSLLLRDHPGRRQAETPLIAPVQIPWTTSIELWWQDEARIGQKNGITRRWARRGTRPRAPHDQRTKWAYIFGAICLAKGKGARLVMPWCDTQAMAEHLKEISLAVDLGCRAVLMLDQAGWHGSVRLPVPANITLLRCRRDPPS